MAMAMEMPSDVAADCFGSERVADASPMPRPKGLFDAAMRRRGAAIPGSPRLPLGRRPHAARAAPAGQD